MDSIFAEIGIIIAIGAVVSLVMHLIKQPLIIGYILTGILVGPVAFDIIHEKEIFEVFSNLGIVLLLFIVGLGLNPKIIREVGKVSSIAGGMQVLATTFIVAALSIPFSFIGSSQALYVGIAAAFSSTIIILKLISDKREQTQLYGKLAVGMLLVQDILATIALLVVAAMSKGGLSILDLGILIVKGGWVIIVLYLISTQILPKFHKIIAGSQEFLFLFALGWGFGIASIFETIGFSIEVGALFAGVSLASLPYAQEISTRLRPLRDFFIVLFFITLGSSLSFGSIGDVILPALAISAAIIIVNPLVVMTTFGLLGYTKRTGFKVALTMAQISEFSLIFLILAERQNLISNDIVAMMTIVALITIAVSTYMIIYTDQIFSKFEFKLTVFERRNVHNERENKHDYEIILFGYQKGGREFLNTFEKMNKRYVVIDYDPEIAQHLEHSNHSYLYGDANDIELLSELNLDKTRMAVSTITDHASTLFLVKYLVKENPKIMVIVTSDTASEAAELYGAGATYVMMPHYLGSEKISSFIKKNGFRKSEFAKFRTRHIEVIEKLI